MGKEGVNGVKFQSLRAENGAGETADLYWFFLSFNLDKHRIFSFLRILFSSVVEEWGQNAYTGTI